MLRWCRPLALALVLTPGLSHAGGGLSTPRIGGIGPHSPNEADVSSVYWNPAAIALLSEKLRLVVDVSYTSARANVQRFVEDGGQPPTPDTLGQEPVSVAVTIPIPFLGGVYKITDKLAVGAAIMAPIGRSGDFIGDCRDLSPVEVDACEKNSPVRYQTTRSNIQSLYASPTVAYKISDKLSLGASLHVVASLFTSDVAIDSTGTEDPNNQAFTHLGAVIADGIDENGISTDDDGDGVALIETKPLTGIGFAGGAGLFYAPTSRLSLGLGYASRTRVKATGTAVNQAIIGGQDLFGVQQGQAEVRYRLPDTFNAGLRFRITERLDLDGYYQFMTYGLHNVIEIDITEMDASVLNREPEDGLPGTALARQFQNSHTVNVGLNYWLPDGRARVGGAVMYEGSAIPDEAQTAASFDPNKIDWMSYVQVLPTPKVRITLGFSLVTPLAPVDNRGESIFKGAFHGDTEGYECDALAGNDRETGLCYPVGNGIYNLSMGRVGLTTSYSF